MNESLDPSPHVFRVGKTVRNPDRREYRRWTCALPATLEAIGAPACEVKLLDVSAGGARFVLAEGVPRDTTWRADPLPPTPCILTVRAADADTLLARVFGTAYRAVVGPSPAPHVPVIAMRFHGPLTPAVREALGCPFQGD
jgi:hypothetical protein